MKPLFKNIDCLQLYVPDLEAGIDYYCNQLGLKIIWKTKTSVGLCMAKGLAEIVIQNERREMETDIKVNSVPEAIRKIKQAGGTIISGPFDIKIGKCAVVKDPWGNQYVILTVQRASLLQMMQGRYLDRKNLDGKFLVNKSICTEHRVS